MQAMVKKLLMAKGETLVETMIAIMITALSAMLLATAMLVASKINKNVENADAEFQTQLNAAEQFSGVPVDGSVHLVFDSSTTTADAAYYGGESELRSYRCSAEGGG